MPRFADSAIMESGKRGFSADARMAGQSSRPPSKKRLKAQSLLSIKEDDFENPNQNQCNVTNASPVAEFKVQVASETEPSTEEKREVHTWRESGVAKVPILCEPVMNKAITGKRLRCNEIFEVDMCKESSVDGRMYLHLVDGRGWVCTTAKNGLSVVEPANEEIRDLEEEILREEERLEKIQERRAALLAAIEDRQQRVRELDEEYEDLCDHPSEDPLSKDVEAQDIDFGVQGATSREQECLAGGSNFLGVDAAVLLPSDEELWPTSLQPAHHLTQAQRVALRRIFCNFSDRIEEVQQDLGEANALIHKYKQKCKTKEALIAQSRKLTQEAAKLHEEWETCVKAELAKRVLPSPAPSESNLDGVVPIQVRAERWFSATIETKANLQNVDAGRSQVLGPLRKSLADAKDDLCRMKRAVGSTNTKFEPSSICTSCPRVSANPSTKRGRGNVVRSHNALGSESPSPSPSRPRVSIVLAKGHAGLESPSK